jgi:hypothetical protein
MLGKNPPEKKQKKITFKKAVTVQQDFCYYKRIHYQTKNYMNVVKKFLHFNWFRWK